MPDNLALCIFGSICILLGAIIAAVSASPTMHSRDEGMSIFCIVVGIAFMMLGGIMVFKLAGLRFYFESP